MSKITPSVTSSPLASIKGKGKDKTSPSTDGVSTIGAPPIARIVKGALQRYRDALVMARQRKSNRDLAGMASALQGAAAALDSLRSVDSRDDQATLTIPAKLGKYPKPARTLTRTGAGWYRILGPKTDERVSDTDIIGGTLA